MKFKMNKIAAAVAVGLGTSVVGTNVAQADEILFPYLVASDTVTSILSVINDDDFAVPDLHYRYYYKRAEAGNGADCVEANYRQPTSENDVVTFDISGHFGDAKGVLFEPTTSTRYDKSFAVFRTIKPVRAFGIIDNNGRFFAGQGIEGEAFIIQYTEGAVWGYRAYNAAGIVGWNGNNVVASNPYDFSDRGEINGEVLVAPPEGTSALGAENFWAPIAIMPFAGEVTTRLFVTPIATESPYQLGGATAATIGLQVNDPFNFSPDVMYDRDENPFSGQIEQPVVCVGAVNVPNMISEATQQFLRTSGGWSNVGVRKGQAVVIKLEFNDNVPSDLDGKPSGGNSFNNGYWVRKGIRESLPRVAIPSVTGPAIWMPVFEVPKDQTLNAPYPLVNVNSLPADLPWPPKQGASAVPYLPFASTVQ